MRPSPLRRLGVASSWVNPQLCRVARFRHMTPTGYCPPAAVFCCACQYRLPPAVNVPFCHVVVIPLPPVPMGVPATGDTYVADTFDPAGQPGHSPPLVVAQNTLVLVLLWWNTAYTSDPSAEVTALYPSPAELVRLIGTGADGFTDSCRVAGGNVPVSPTPVAPAGGVPGCQVAPSSVEYCAANGCAPSGFGGSCSDPGT